MFSGNRFITLETAHYTTYDVWEMLKLCTLKKIVHILILKNVRVFAELNSKKCKINSKKNSFLRVLFVCSSGFIWFRVSIII